MPIRRATIDDLAAILAYEERAELISQQPGLETLERLLRSGVVAIGEETGKVWGVCAVDTPHRPASLPLDVPYSAAVALLAVQRAKRLTKDGERLVRAALSTGVPAPVEYLHLCREPKLAPLLVNVGFARVEVIRFMRLVNLPKRILPAAVLPAGVRLTSCSTAEIDHLVGLDAETFPPRWHSDRAALITLSLSSHVRLLWSGGQLAGYGAITTGAHEALLDRIAVAAHHRGRGFGDLLMRDLLAIAQREEAHTVLLNTQDHNRPAQALYRRHGFRFTGRSIPVYVLQAAAKR